MVISILLAQQKKLRELEYKLNHALWQKINAKELNGEAKTETQETS
jgi:very-short-patch-repair endonuclease